MIEIKIWELKNKIINLWKRLKINQIIQRKSSNLKEFDWIFLFRLNFSLIFFRFIKENKEIERMNEPINDFKKLIEWIHWFKEKIKIDEIKNLIVQLIFVFRIITVS